MVRRARAELASMRPDHSRPAICRRDGETVGKEGGTCHAVDKQAAPGGSVQAGVAHEGRLAGLEWRVGRGHDGDLPPGDALAHVVVGLSGQLDLDAVHQEAGERLPCAALQSTNSMLTPPLSRIMQLGHPALAVLALIVSGSMSL